MHAYRRAARPIHPRSADERAHGPAAQSDPVDVKRARNGPSRATAWSGNEAAARYHAACRDPTYVSGEAEIQSDARANVLTRPRPALFKTYAGAKRVSIPEAEPTWRTSELDRVLLRRRTVRKFHREPVEPRRFARLLRMTFGISAVLRSPLFGPARRPDEPLGRGAPPDRGLSDRLERPWSRARCLPLRHGGQPGADPPGGLSRGSGPSRFRPGVDPRRRIPLHPDRGLPTRPLEVPERGLLPHPLPRRGPSWRRHSASSRRRSGSGPSPPPRFRIRRSRSCCGSTGSRSSPCICAGREYRRAFPGVRRRSRPRLVCRRVRPPRLRHRIPPT